MKVRCTADGSWHYERWYSVLFFWRARSRKWAKGPKKGDIVTVQREYWSEGEKFYNLVEWPLVDGMLPGYDATCFEPLQELATEFEEVTYSEIKKEVPVSAN